MSDSNVFRPLVHNFGKTTLHIEYGDLTALNADILVSSDDIDLSMGGGVSGALRKIGGASVWNEAQRKAPIELGDIAITTAGHLKAKHIFHAAVLDRRRPYLTTIDLIRKVTKKCLVGCDKLSLQSIAFPALATGAARLSPERSSVAMLLEITAHVNFSTNIKSIIIALYPRAGLPQNVLYNFYAQVSDFLEMTQRLNNLTATLDNLERVYRALSLDKEAESTAFSREDIKRHRGIWENEMLQREPENYRRENMWRKYQEEIEPDLRVFTSLNNQPAEREINEYLITGLRETISMRKKNIVDYQKEQAKGFSVEINRKLESEQQELSKLEAKLHELEQMIQGQWPY